MRKHLCYSVRCFVGPIIPLASAGYTAWEAQGMISGKETNVTVPSTDTLSVPLPSSQHAYANPCSVSADLYTMSE